MSKEVIKEVTSSVLKYILPDTWSDAKKEANPIAAERVVEAIKDGKKVEIKNAVIDGPFILKSVNVEGEVTIQRTKIRGPIDWSYATFKRVLNLGNSIFETFETDATFTAVTVEKDIFWMGRHFVEKQYLLISQLWELFTVDLQPSRKRLYSLMGLSKKGSNSVKALLWVRLTLEAHESVVMLYSPEPRLRSRLISIVPRSMGMLSLTRLLLWVRLNS